MGIYEEATGFEVGFIDWMKLAVPVVLIMLPVVGYWLTRRIASIEPIELPSVGKWRKEEIRTLMVFGVTALFWVTRQQPFGGWVGFAGAQGGVAELCQRRVSCVGGCSSVVCTTQWRWW
jgi:sodium-dependent dicarboxylate transporter 2/3/5